MTAKAGLTPEPASRTEPSPVTDEALLVRYCQEGDQDVFRELVERYEPELYHYLCRYLHNASLAEEVLQATFLRLHQHRDRFQPDHPVRPWLYTIATHLAIDALRCRGRHPAVSLDTEHGEDATLLDLVVGASDDPVVRLEGEEQRQWLRRAVAELPSHLREPLDLVYFAGMKYSDAAEKLNVPLGTLKSRLHEALVKLNRASTPVSKADNAAPA
ncbi:MAG TPA: RNA polymerase sigma factor [Pirellulales bacterium]|nr:RNA polymerase sigma factor [Pirellulales bacterium]